MFRAFNYRAAILGPVLGGLCWLVIKLLSGSADLASQGILLGGICIAFGSGPLLENEFSMQAVLFGLMCACPGVLLALVLFKLSGATLLAGILGALLSCLLISCRPMFLPDRAKDKPASVKQPSATIANP